jgi:pimeloyl-ACP methyl ester carboxylesterase
MQTNDKGALLRREAIAVARQGRLMLAALRRPKRLRPIDSDRVVIFVHGYMAAGAVFDPMRARVERELGLPTADFSYGPFGTFDQIVELLADHIAGAVHAEARVSLVGHSLGGLIARWYAQERPPERTVDRLVTLATPHAGTDSARFAPGSLGAALRPGSVVVERLKAGRSTCEHIPHVSLVAGRDRMCSPPESAASLESAEVVWIDDLGHNELLFDERVHRTVVHALR